MVIAMWKSSHWEAFYKSECSAKSCLTILLLCHCTQNLEKYRWMNSFSANLVDSQPLTLLIIELLLNALQGFSTQAWAYFLKNSSCWLLVKVKRRLALWTGESGLVDLGVRFRIGMIPVQTPLGTRSGLGTQPHYKTSGDLRVEQVSIRRD